MSRLFLSEYEPLSSSTSSEGGFATVYKVRHHQLGYIRAIRVLKDTILGPDDPKYHKFLEECKLLMRLGNGGHPNIVRIVQPRLLDNKALVEMEYIHGTDLNDYLLEESGYMEYDEVLKCMTDIAGALAYCHFDIYQFCFDKESDNLRDDDFGNALIPAGSETERRLVNKYKVIHNDIHSKNIIRKYDGSYILLDFGLAIQNDTVVKSSTRKGGVDEYKAPEKWDDEGIITEQTDIYSFGILMYEILTGSVPFQLKNKNSFAHQSELQKQHANEPPPAIQLKRKEVFEVKYPGQIYEKDFPDWMEEVILKCLSKSPEDRFKNGRELYDFILEKSNWDRKTVLDIRELEKLRQELTHRDKLLDEKHSLLETKRKKVENLEADFKELNTTLSDYKAKSQQLEQEIKKLKRGSRRTRKTKVVEPRRKRSYWPVYLTAFLVLFSVILYWIKPGIILGENGIVKTVVSVFRPVKDGDVENKNFKIAGDSYSYTGPVRNRLPNGYGKAIYTSGLGVYKGRFKDGLRHGKGILTLMDGSIFEGTFIDNQMEGVGKFTYNDGKSFYEGEFKNGLMHGVGNLYDARVESTIKVRYENNKFAEKL